MKEQLIVKLLELLLAAPETKTAQPAEERPVLVTTAHRGVFFGYATDTDGDTIALARCRMCVYWSADMKGVLGLASIGPSATCRVSPAADVVLRNVTAVAECSDAAVKAWEVFPWQP